MGDVIKPDSPPTPARCKQYDLFTEFYGDGEYSNTAELWDAMPKNAVTARRQSAMRDANGRLPMFEHSFTHASKAYRIELLPALIREEDGSVRDYYPSMDEELVEEVLRKFFADARFGQHDAQEAESWVRFTLSMVRKELKAKGRTRSINEIKRSLEIMSRCTINLYVGTSKEPAFSGSIFSDVLRVTRQAYIEDGKSMWAARLPVLLSTGVNQATYRQFNYGVLMALEGQLARYLHKRLSHRFTNAGTLQTYRIRFSTLQQDSGLLTRKRISENVKTVDAALDELVAAGVLMRWTKEEERGARNHLQDATYTFYPSQTFIAEMRAMNKRHEMIDVELGKRERPKRLGSGQRRERGATY